VWRTWRGGGCSAAPSSTSTGKAARGMRACRFDDHVMFPWLTALLSLIFPPRRRIFQAWVTDAASVILEASQEDGKQVRAWRHPVQLMMPRFPSLPPPPSPPPPHSPPPPLPPPPHPHPQSADVKLRLQVLLDAKMTLDEALQLRCSPATSAATPPPQLQRRHLSCSAASAARVVAFTCSAETCSRKPATAITRQPLAAADAAELMLASERLGMVES
jgi:hypothetical protein